MDNERLPLSQLAGKALDFLLIVVPIVWTAIVVAVIALVIAVAVLPDLVLPTCAGSAAILVIVRWVNFRQSSRSAGFPGDEP